MFEICKLTFEFDCCRCLKKVTITKIFDIKKEDIVVVAKKIKQERKKIKGLTGSVCASCVENCGISTAIPTL